VKLDFSRPGRPPDNAFCESFNNRVRQEQLNPNWFHSLDDARRQAAAWRVDYNTHHPHSSLGDRTPEEFAREANTHPEKAAISRARVGQESEGDPSLCGANLWPHPNRPSRALPIVAVSSISASILPTCDDLWDGQQGALRGDSAYLHFTS